LFHWPAAAILTAVIQLCHHTLPEGKTQGELKNVRHVTHSR